MPSQSITANVAKGAKQFDEAAFATARNGAGEGVGISAGIGGTQNISITVGIRDEKTKSGTDVVHSFTFIRFMMNFQIPDLSGATVTSATITFTTNTFNVIAVGSDARSALSKGKLVAATLTDATEVSAGDYDSVNIASPTDYDDTSGITMSATADQSIAVTLNTAAVNKINTFTSGGGNFQCALIEYEHDYSNDDTLTYMGHDATGTDIMHQGFRIDSQHVDGNPLSTTGITPPALEITYATVIKAGKVTITNKIPIMTGKISLVDTTS